MTRIHVHVMKPIEWADGEPVVSACACGKRSYQ